ncbi:orf6 protein [Fievel mouse coronavirus]|nr:orf6 protein [Fievel mouse coronavirus]
MVSHVSKCFIIVVFAALATCAPFDPKTTCSFSFSSLLVDGAVRFDTVDRATFSNCYFNWEDWFDCTGRPECELVKPILAAFMPNDTAGLFQQCNGIKAIDFDTCVNGFVIRYGALFVPDGALTYSPLPGECFGQRRVLTSVIWYITEHVRNDLCCSHREASNPFVPNLIKSFN